MLKYPYPPVWWNGRHKGLKIPRHNNRAGSTPATGTTKKRAFVPGQKHVFLSEACLAAREAPLRAVKLLRSEAPAGVSSTLPLTSRSARSFTAAPPPLHLAPPTFTLRPAQTFTIRDEQNGQKEQPANTATGNQKSLGRLKDAKTVAR